MIKLLGLCGSLRKESFNRMLLYEAIKISKKCKFEEIELELPLYNSDIQNNGFPEKVKNLSESILNCDGIIIVSPEYNKGVSGVLKNALDWTSRINRDLWKEKPVVIMSVASGRSGGQRPMATGARCSSFRHFCNLAENRWRRSSPGPQTSRRGWTRYPAPRSRPRGAHRCSPRRPPRSCARG